jgi:hypothetical protein
MGAPFRLDSRRAGAPGEIDVPNHGTPTADVDGVTALRPYDAAK